MTQAHNTIEQGELTRPSEFNAAEARKDFPVLQEEFFGHPLVYLDSGASAQKPEAVIAAVDHYYRHDHANVHRGVYTLSERATQAYEGAREKTMSFLNARSIKEIIHVRGTTEAINLVAQSYGRSKLGPEDEILITAMEHHSNIVPWQLLCEQVGATLKVVPLNDAGELLINEFDNLLNSRTRIVAFTHVSNALGTINPIKEMIDKAHQVDAVTVIDGAQAVPHMSVDVQALDCDFYAFSSHKLFGPTGIGVLYGKQELLEEMPPYQGGGEMIRTVTFEKTVYHDLPYKFEAGTPHIAGAVGLGAAIDYLANFDMNAIGQHENQLLQRACELAQDRPFLSIIGNAEHRASIFSFVLEGIHPHDIGTIIDREGIAIRTGHHCAMPVMHRYKVPATARASFALYNTLQDVDALFSGIDKVRKVFTS
ncbi:cysteine desulfurase [Pseudomonadota bacterium]